MVAKKGYLLLSIVALLSISGCRHKKVAKSPKSNHVAYNNGIFRNVDIPLAGEEVALSDEEINSFFDEDTNEFVSYGKQGNQNSPDILSLTEDEIDELQKSDYAWIDADKENEFRKIYFEFDKHNVRDDQKSIVESDIVVARELLKEARANGENPTFVIEGHACKIGTNKAYNTALSQKRAKAVSDFFISEGVPQENIKFVGRGQDVPVVEGDRDQQWANRRVEVKVIYS